MAGDALSTIIIEHTRCYNLPLVLQYANPAKHGQLRPVTFSGILVSTHKLLLFLGHSFCSTMNTAHREAPERTDTPRSTNNNNEDRSILS
ncbi:predicted protein [Lichtheimia corymbifera JMRC:FSU:9682]|uniref:Uncharacterized protein n=1 Tax=Lichtheimia corymbifera JMRC:FSU:9682 TaxID=1263082 RepID=A0A068S4U8_9FUNG|nr:predicted protein [Lichtheimia corymbifera JMRC:FSU:9682]